MFPGLGTIIDLFFPRHCPGCQRILTEQQEVLCWVCVQHLAFTQHLHHPDHEMHRALYGRYRMPHASALLYYRKADVVQRLVHHIKYRGRTEIGYYFGRWHGEQLKRVTALSHAHALLPVPLHPKRLRERGYNQVLSFAQGISEVLCIPIWEHSLVKMQHTQSQTHKNVIERDFQSRQVFALGPEAPSPGQHVVLVDDVFTTGATVEACLQVLHQIPHLQVSVITLACAQN